MTEWLKVPVLKTGVGTPYRGFESLSLRHFVFTRTLGSRYVTEEYFIFNQAATQPRSQKFTFIFLYLIFLPFLSDGVCLEFYSMLY